MKPTNMKLLSTLSTIIWLSGSLASAGENSIEPSPNRPNVLWFVVDDMSPNFSCYGETTIQTLTECRSAGS